MMFILCILHFVTYLGIQWVSLETRVCNSQIHHTCTRTHSTAEDHDLQYMKFPQFTIL